MVRRDKGRGEEHHLCDDSRPVPPPLPDSCGLDVSLQQYTFEQWHLTGLELLQLSAQRLENVGVHKIGHQELILAAVEKLCFLSYSQADETVSSLAEKLRAMAHSLQMDLQSRWRVNTYDGHKVTTVPNQELQIVLDLMATAKALGSLLSRYEYGELTGYTGYKAIPDLCKDLGNIMNKLYSTLLCSTLLYSTLLFCTLLNSTLFYSAQLYSTLLYSTLLCSSVLCSTLLSSTLLSSTLLYSTLLYSTLLFCTLLNSTLFYSAQLYSSLLYSTLFYSSNILCSTMLYSTPLYSALLYSTLLYSALLYSAQLYSLLLYSTLLYSTLLYSSLYFTLLFCTLLNSTLLYSTLLYSTLLYSTLISSTLLFCTLLSSTLLYSTLLFCTLLYSALLYFTLLYSAQLYFTLLYSALLYFTLLYSAQLYFTLLCSSVLYSTLLSSTLLYSTLLFCTLLYSTLLYSALLYFTLLCSALLYSTLFCSALLYSTLLYSAQLYFTLLYSTLLYSTLISSTLLFCTLLSSTLLYSTLLYSNLFYLLFCTLLSSTLLYSTLLSSTLLFCTLLNSTLLYSALLYFTLLYSTLLCSTLLYSALLYSAQLYFTLLYSAQLYFTLLYSSVLCSTLLYSTLLFCTLLYSTLLCSTLLYSALLYSAQLYFTLLYSALLYFTLLYSAQLYFTLLYSTLLFCTLLYSAQLYFTLLYSAQLYFTLLYSSSALLYSAQLYFTLLYFAQLYFTLLYSTLLYSTLLYSTLLCSSVLCSALLYSTLLYTLISSSLLFCTLLSSTLLYSTLLYSTLLYSTDKTLLDKEKDIISVSRQLVAICDDVLSAATEDILNHTSLVQIVDLVPVSPGEQLGIEITSTSSSQHFVSGTFAELSADCTEKILEGDEVIKVNDQVVVGWTRKNLVAKLQENPKGVTLLLRRLPPLSAIYKHKDKPTQKEEEDEEEEERNRQSVIERAPASVRSYSFRAAVSPKEQLTGLEFSDHGLDGNQSRSAHTHHLVAGSGLERRCTSLLSLDSRTRVGSWPEMGASAEEKETKKSSFKGTRTALSRRRVSCRELGLPDCDGWLWKKRKEMSVFMTQKWQRFWFVLKGVTIYWYTSQQEEKAVGLVKIGGYSIESAGEHKRKYVFKMFHPRFQSFFFAADNVSDMSKWINCLIVAIQKYKKHQQNPPDNEAECYSETESEEDSSHSPLVLKKKTTTKPQCNTLPRALGKKNKPLGGSAPAGGSKASATQPQGAVDEMGELFNQLKEGGVSLIGQKQPITHDQLRRSFIRRNKNPVINEKVHTLRALQSTLKAKEAELQLIDKLLEESSLTPLKFRQWRQHNEDLYQEIEKIAKEKKRTTPQVKTVTTDDDGACRLSLSDGEQLVDAELPSDGDLAEPTESHSERADSSSSDNYFFI
ncbi:hypothetical protein QTP86_030967 [Hemibagrus guttatus]|nr:hypothetical protein QTP86_030967 [Hemibagrus guttatus]